MATTVEKPTLDQVLERYEELKKHHDAVMKKLNEPDYSKTRTDDLGRITGFYEGTDESVDIRISPDSGEARKSLKRQHKDNFRLMKSLGYEPGNKFQSFGDFIKFGVENRTNPSKIEAAVGDHVKKLLDYEKAHPVHNKSIQGLSTLVGADGGYTIMPEFAPGIIDRVYNNDLLNRTDSYNVSGNSMTFLANAETSRATGSRHGGLQGYWMGEGEALTKSKPTMREITLKLHKLGVLVYLTDELISDTSMALQQYITRKAGEEFNFMIGDALINGNGISKPLGILNFPSLLTISKETGQGAATIQIENLVKMWARFYAPNLGNSILLKNQDVTPQLNLMTMGIGAAGVPVYLPPGGVSGAPYETVYGRPTLNTEFNATLGTVGDLILADMSQIISIQKGGIAQAVSMHVEFLTDQLAVRFIMRMNANPWENSVITPYKGTSNTQSNFITLDTRA